MPQYATFDHTVPEPSPVTGWYDNDIVVYPNFPDDADLLLMTAEQWVARMSQYWAVENGTLVPYTPPAPTLTPDQLAAAELATHIATGISITGNAGLVATYALDPVSTAEIFQLGLYASQFDTFPGGTTQAYPDATGIPHTFTVAQFVAFLRAVAPLVSALTTQASIMAHGGTAVWPQQTANIT